MEDDDRDIPQSHDLTWLTTELRDEPDILWLRVPPPKPGPRHKNMGGRSKRNRAGIKTALSELKEG